MISLFLQDDSSGDIFATIFESLAPPQKPFFKNCRPILVNLEPNE